MPADRKRTKITCTNCSKVFSMQDAEIRRRLRKSKTGELFCSVNCFFEYKKAKKTRKSIGGLSLLPLRSPA